MIAMLRVRISGLAVLAYLLTLSFGTLPALADIDLEWRPLSQTVNVNDAVGIGLYAVSDSEEDQLFNSVQVIITWDPVYLELIGTDLTGGIGLDSAAFTAGDSFGFNESNPPTDGDGICFGFAPIAFPPVQLPATQAGSLLATIVFDALVETPSTLVNMLASGLKPGLPLAETMVMSGTYDVFGNPGVPASVTIVPEPASLVFLVLGALALSTRRR